MSSVLGGFSIILLLLLRSRHERHLWNRGVCYATGLTWIRHPKQGLLSTNYMSVASSAGRNSKGYTLKLYFYLPE